VSNPKFAVGDRVAVLAMMSGLPTICYPETVVDEVILGGKYKKRFVYGVKADETYWFDAEFLRPILPGEYLESTQDSALPVDGVSA
jgi:hypothetical protein